MAVYNVDSKTVDLNLGCLEQVDCPLEPDIGSHKQDEAFMTRGPSTTQDRSDRRPFQVTVAQISPTLGDLDVNMDLHFQALDESIASGSDLTVFPELSMTGYYLRDQVPEVAEPAWGPRISALAERTSTSSGHCAAVGFVEEDPATLYYNAAAWIESGRLTALHRKVYLPTYGMFDEQRYFAAGDRVRAIPTRLGRLGILICEDAWHLSCGVILQADRIDLLLILCNSPGRGVDGSQLGSRQTWELNVRTYATFLGVPVIFANRTGYEDGVCFWGGSLIIDANGQVLARGPELESALVTATIDPRVKRRQRILAPLHRDERTELVLNELERIRRERLTTPLDPLERIRRERLATPLDPTP